MDQAALIALSALRLQLEWGADEALAATALDRLRVQVPVREPAGPADTDRTPSSRPRPRLTPLMSAAQLAQDAAGSAGTLAELRAAIGRFEHCPLRDTATSLVFADGPEDARVMLIGDAPGPDDDRAGRPFAGPAGVYLDRMLASIGFGRSTVRLTTLLPWRPPGDRPPTEAEIAACLPFLRRHIALVRPAYLLIAGRHGCAALAGEAARRGRRPQPSSWIDASIADGETIPALILPPPSMTRRTPTARRETWRALCVLRRTLDGA